jgi:hypothetical protein
MHLKKRPTICSAVVPTPHTRNMLGQGSHTDLTFLSWMQIRLRITKEHLQVCDNGAIDNQTQILFSCGHYLFVRTRCDLTAPDGQHTGAVPTRGANPQDLIRKNPNNSRLAFASKNKIFSVHRVTVFRRFRFWPLYAFHQHLGTLPSLPLQSCQRALGPPFQIR